MCLSVNARSVRRSSGTSFDFALLGLGAEVAANHETETVLSLSVNDTAELVVVRAHPSGTRTSKPPFAERYGTNCVLSGMSPGGLLSAGTGDSGVIAGSVGDERRPVLCVREGTG